MEGPYITEARKSCRLCYQILFCHLPILPFGDKILLVGATSIGKSEPFDQLVLMVSVCPYRKKPLLHTTRSSHAPNSVSS
jgi:hypothetical protein